MLESRMSMKVALVVMVPLIIGAHFVAAGEKISLHVHKEKHRLQFLTWEHNYSTNIENYTQQQEW